MNNVGGQVISMRYIYIFPSLNIESCLVFEVFIEFFLVFLSMNNFSLYLELINFRIILGFN